MALAAWSIALLGLAAEHRRPPGRGRRCRRGAGGLYFTYGLVPLLAALGAVRPVARRRTGLLVAAAGGGRVVSVAWTAAGFWWLDGLDARAPLLRRARRQRPALRLLPAWPTWSCSR